MKGRCDGSDDTNIRMWQRISIAKTYNSGSIGHAQRRLCMVYISVPKVFNLFVKSSTILHFQIVVFTS